MHLEWLVDGSSKISTLKGQPQTLTGLQHKLFSSPSASRPNKAGGWSWTVLKLRITLYLLCQAYFSRIKSTLNELFKSLPEQISSTNTVSPDSLTRLKLTFNCDFKLMEKATCSNVSVGKSLQNLSFKPKGVNNAWRWKAWLKYSQCCGLSERCSGLEYHVNIVWKTQVHESTMWRHSNGAQANLTWLEVQIIHNERSKQAPHASHVNSADGLLTTACLGRVCRTLQCAGLWSVVLWRQGIFINRKTFPWASARRQGRQPEA